MNLDVGSWNFHLESSNSYHQLPGLSAIKLLDKLVYHHLEELLCTNAAEVRGNTVRKVWIRSNQVWR